MPDTKKAVVKQAAFLMAAQMISSVISLLYRTPLHLIMGDLGDGYYSMVYDWYTIILLISSYSIPSAVSKVMAERLARKEYKDAQKVFHAALIYVAIVGGVGALLAYFGAPLFLSTQPDAVLALRILAPTILLSGFLGSLRGYFQAQNTMMPTAISQVAEQVVNAVMSVLAAWLFTRAVLGDDNLVGKFGAAGGCLGTGAGVVTGIIIMLVIYGINKRTIKKRISRDRTGKDETYGEVFKVILLMVTPIIFATFIYNVSANFNQLIYTNLMTARGVSAKDIASQYGLFGYRFKPIINIPVALASATSTALIPAVAASMGMNKRSEAAGKIDECIKLSMFIAIPSAVGMCILSYPAIRLLYPTGDVQSAAVLLSFGAVSVVFYSLSTVTNGVLQGLGHPSVPVRNAAIALGVDIASAFLFVGVLNIGVFGILLATVLYSFTVMTLNGMAVKGYIGFANKLKKNFFIPLEAAGVMGVVIGVLYWVPALILKKFFARLIVSDLWTVVVVIVGILVYIVAYTRLAGLSDDEMRRLPMGTRLLSLLRKMKLR